jgi:drug/metabolite transporter (DMT)-like permease
MTNEIKNKPTSGRSYGFANPWLQLGLSVMCVFMSELLLKRGATDVAEPQSAFSWTGINGLQSPLVWWAILLIIASFISWLYVLRYIPITIAYPLSRVVDVLVPLGCWIFLGESISALRWFGIALVVIGLALVAKPVAQIEERL